MKSHAILFLVAFLLSLAGPLAAAEPSDPFETGMREAFASYRKGDREATTAKLRELIALLEKKDANDVSRLLPDTLKRWKGESIETENLGFLGGGVAVSRRYVAGERKILVKVIKDSPVVKQLLPLLTNDELLRLSNRQTHRISGETAIMENERKLQMVLDDRILLEATGNDDTSESDVVSLVRLLDLNALAKMK